MTETLDPWGPHRATIEDHIDTCADYLGRLRRSLAGEIAPDRYYFSDRPTSSTPPPAVWTGWSRTSTVGSAIALPPSNTPTPTAPVSPPIARCQPATTEPTTTANRPPASRRLIGELRDLADTVERVSQQFGWIAPDIERDLTGAPGTATSSHDAFANLAVNLDTLGGRVRRLSGRVRELALDPGQKAVDAPREVESPPRSRMESPELEL